MVVQNHTDYEKVMEQDVEARVVGKIVKIGDEDGSGEVDEDRVVAALDAGKGTVDEKDAEP